MKRITYIIAILFACTSCSDTFLDNAPKGKYHEGNYDMGTAQELLVLATLMDGYNVFAQQTWPVTAMQCHTTDNSHPGGPSGDGGVDFSQFPTMSFTPANSMFNTYYSLQFTAITKANEALQMLKDIEEANGETAATRQYRAEAYFIRAAAYFRLTQAFGAVPYVDRVMGKDEAMADQLSATVIRNKYLPELIGVINDLPTRKEAVNSGNIGRATQNAARAIIAKTYLYEKDYNNCLTYTGQIISSEDNDLSTPYAEMFWEENEFGPESVWEINADYKPDQNISIIGENNQWCLMNGVRGFPNLGWGHNAPSENLMNDYESNDPRFGATVLEHGEKVDGEEVVASNYQYFNRKAYCRKSERSLYGRADWCYGYWSNLRIIRYADIVLMRAELENELNGASAAVPYLTKIRNRAFATSDRATEVTAYVAEAALSKEKMFQAIVDERAYEFAGELIRKADLIRWGMLKSKMDETKNKMKAIVSLTDYDSKHPYSQLSGHAYYKMSAYTWTRNGIETTEKDAKLNLYGLNYGEMDINPEGYTEFSDSKGEASTWIKDNALEDVIDYLYVRDPDKYQYWPIFNVNLNDNPNLSNYEWY